MLEVWKAKQIHSLSKDDVEQWFDVLNYGLVEDRGFSMTDSNIDEIQDSIKKDYIHYLMACSDNENFQGYYILRGEHGMIVSVCRVVEENGIYYLEGLETHRDYYHKGYASTLLKHLLYKLKKDGISKLFSLVRNHNEKSLNFHKKNGFRVVRKDHINTKFILNVKDRIREFLFDDWSKNYHQSVIDSERAKTYPFAGYSEIKYQIMETVTTLPKARILDMGVGTGEIANPCYDLGYEITGVDLSEKMITIAKEKMPNALFIHANFQIAITQLKGKYDYIIFNYAMHHLKYDNQIAVLERLYKFLNKDGLIIIGDVSTINVDELKRLKHKYAAIWDNEEYYPMLQSYQKSKLKDLYAIEYKQLNQVAGLYKFRKR